MEASWSGTWSHDPRLCYHAPAHSPRRTGTSPDRPFEGIATWSNTNMTRISLIVAALSFGVFAGGASAFVVPR